MNWILDSLFMFLASVVMYLFIRKGQKQQIPLLEYLVAMFVLPLMGYAIAIPLGHSSFLLPLWQLGFIALAAFFFSYIGNLLSQKSILLASNPGYSLTITKSYVILTTILAVILFHSRLTIQAIIAIILIISFSAVISIGRQKGLVGKENIMWLFLALGAFFCFAGLALFSTYMVKLNINVFVYLFYLFLFVSIFIISEFIRRKVKIIYNRQTFPTLLIIGIMSLFFNLFMQLGYKNSPNPGYINAVNAASITLVTILSSVFFKDELNARKIIGVIGVTVGLVLLFL